MSVLICSMSANTAGKDFRKDVYERWAKHSNEYLMRFGNSKMLDPDIRQKDLALLCFTIVSNRYTSNQYKKEDLPLIVNAMNSIGYMYMFVYYDYPKSYTSLDMAREIAEREQMNKVLPRIYLDMALLKMISNEAQQSRARVDETIRGLKKPFYAALKQKDWNILIIALSNIVNLSVVPVNQTESIQKEIDIFYKLNLQDSIPQVKHLYYTCKAVEMFKKKNYRKALEYYRKADKYIFVKQTPERYRIQDFINMAYTHRKLGENDEAIALLKDGVNIAVKYDAKDAIVNILEELYYMYKNLGQKHAADSVQLLYLKRKDALLNENHLLNLNEIEFQSNLRKVSEQMKEEVQRRKLQSILLWVTVVIVVIIIISLLMLWHRYREVQDRNLHLYKKNEENLRTEKEANKQRTELEKQVDSLKKEIKNLSSSSKVETDYDSDENTESAKQQANKSKATANSSLDEEYKNVIINRIENVMTSSDDVYLADFSLNRLSELVEAKPRHVSQIVNEKYGHFYAILNNYRIKEACRRFHDPKYFHLSIEAISQGLGFKSRSNFVQVFKRITGLTPSEYQKLSKADLLRDETDESD